MLIVLPLVLIWTQPVPDSELVAGALMESVPPLAPVVWLRLMTPLPTKTSCVPVTPVAPAVFPRLLAPALIAPAPRFGALITIVFELPESVILLPPDR